MPRTMSVTMSANVNRSVSKVATSHGSAPLRASRSRIGQVAMARTAAQASAGRKRSSIQTARSTKAMTSMTRAISCQFGTARMGSPRSAPGRTGLRHDRRSPGLPPGLGRETFKLGVVRRVWVSVRGRFRFDLPHELVQMHDKNRTDRMDGVVAVEPFRHEALERTDRDLLSQRDLVLDDGMNDRVHRRAWQANTLAAMVILDQVDPFLLVQRQPFLRVGRRERIVFIHCGASGRVTARSGVGRISAA